MKDRKGQTGEIDQGWEGYPACDGCRIEAGSGSQGLRMLKVFQLFLIVLLAESAGPPLRADDVLFIGNSFTFGGSALVVQRNGGVPKLFEAIARAKGHQVTAFAVTAGGQDWSYHLAQPKTEKALMAKVWTWVVLQDLSTRPTQIGDEAKFLADGETFSDRIAQHSPNAGIVLYETWARPAGKFYETPPGNAFTGGPAQMMAQLLLSYDNLSGDLAAKNATRPVRVARVGTAFARIKSEYPGIVVDAQDQHHATAAGYYEAALLMDEAIYDESVKGAPNTFFNGALVIPPDEAAKLQSVADEVMGR
jgi:hypothetical protein